jgi:hypothetical protein
VTTKTTKKATTRKATARKLPELTFEDAIRQAITQVINDEDMLSDLGSKEKSLLVRAVFDDHEDGLHAVVRGHVLATFFDLFGDDEDEDEDEDDDEDEDEDDEDEDEDDEDEDEDEDDE